jgi:hypothetical protein
MQLNRPVKPDTTVHVFHVVIMKQDLNRALTIETMRSLRSDGSYEYVVFGYKHSSFFISRGNLQKQIENALVGQSSTVVLLRLP